MALTGYAQAPQQAAISVDLSQQTQEISPLIYGQFIEFLGRCIDGGLYDPLSPLSNEQGFREDVLTQVKALQTPILRFPGGTVVKIYHWKDGIGPKEDRPKRNNLIWGGTMDNHFGTAEFVTYCREIGAEPFLVVNMSSDSPTDACDWVEYCNGTGDTYWANLRRAHGYPEPFQVKYWGIGNEEYAEPDAGIHQDVNRYIEDSWHIVKLMKLQDPTIKIALVGNSEDMEWSRQVISQMHTVCDYLSIHYYAMPRDTTHANILMNVSRFGRTLDRLRELVKEVPAQVERFPMWYRFPPRQEPLKLAIDEWGIWDMNSGKGTGVYNMEYPYNWSHALAVGVLLNTFQRNADIIGLATWAQMVNVLAAITTTDQGSYCQTVYTPLQAYREHLQSCYLPISVDSPALNERQKAIDATATVSEDKKEITLALLNLSETDTVTTTVQFNEQGHAMSAQLVNHIVYSAPSVDAVNTLENNVVSKTEKQGKTSSKAAFEVTLQPASLNFVKFKVR